MYDLVIIGGGPAGLTATMYALRKRLNFLLISRDLGGKTNYALDLPNTDRHHVISGDEIIKRFVNEIEHLDFARVLARVQEVQEIQGGYRIKTQEDKTYDARAIVIATGANARSMNVPGEREFLMRGISYSALSYAPLFADRTAIVVGDTDDALRATLELARIAHHVTLVTPNPLTDESAWSVPLRYWDNVTVLEGYRPTRVKGQTFARALVVQFEGEERELQADGIFVEMGLEPNSDFVAGLLLRDENGRILTDAHNRTSAPGIFAAGDVTNAPAEQVLIAIGEGAKAALGAYEFILAQPSPTTQTAQAKQ